MRKLYKVFMTSLFISLLIFSLISCSEEKQSRRFPTELDSSPFKNQETATPTPNGGLNTTCTGCNNLAITSNEEFSIELIDFMHNANLVTLTYRVCKLRTGPDVKDLSHWILELDLLLYELAEGLTLSDLFVNCSILNSFGGETCGLVDPDPTTQVIGIKFDTLSLGDGQGQTYMITLDESTLTEGYQIGQGCVVTTTKAGNQNITDSSTPDPGFACVIGPVPEERS